MIIFGFLRKSAISARNYYADIADLRRFQYYIKIIIMNQTGKQKPARINERVTLYFTDIQFYKTLFT